MRSMLLSKKKNLATDLGKAVHFGGYGFSRDLEAILAVSDTGIMSFSLNLWS